MIAWTPEDGVETALCFRERNVAMILRLSHIANKNKTISRVRSQIFPRYSVGLERKMYVANSIELA